MWRVTWKGLLAHKLRLILTSLAIVLGVTFISGTLVLTDTLHNTFTTLFGQVYQHVDFEVRAKAAFSGSGGQANPRPPIPDSIVQTVQKVPGVAYANGSVQGYAQFVAKDGKAISSGGAPNLGFSFDDNSNLSSLKLVDGSPPNSPHDVVMDVGTAQKYHFSVGDQVRVLLPGPTQTFTISGLVRFGSADNLAGATIAGFDLPTAQKLFNLTGRVDTVDVLTAPGASKQTVEHSIASVLPKGTEVVTGQTLANEATSQVNQGLSFFSTALLIFAFISLFVGAFTIFNTFSIIVGQRTRELALLRIVGASRKQVFRSVLLEAGVLGALSSLAGLGLGVLAALGLEALMKGFGITLPSGPLAFESHTVIAALVVGIGVTLVSAISPARRAVRIPPVAALSDYHSTHQESSRRRFVVGLVIAVVGIAALAGGLTGSAIQLVGVGAVAIFIGIGMLAPLVARPMASVLGRPLAAVLGVSGRLGRENSMRSPRRTAQTSAALMVGLALVSTIAVFGASLSKSATSAVDEAVSADYIITATGNGGNGQFGSSVATAAQSAPSAGTVSTVYGGSFEIKGSRADLAGLSPEHLSDTVILRMDSKGSGPAALATGQLLIDSSTATTKHLSVGSVVPVKFVDTGSSTIRVGGIFKPNGLLGNYLVGNGYFKAHFNNPQPVAVLVAARPGSTGLGHQLDKALKSYPNVQVQSKAAFEKSQQNQVNQLLGLVYVLLALAVLIALIGIVNTLLLSVFERTHEIGLLRAVGMKRRQVRAMIRSESLILALFGGIIGICVGTLLGTAFSWSLRQQGITDIVVPVSSLVVFVILSGLLGLGAASWPARRAAKLDVLSAIAAE